MGFDRFLTETMTPGNIACHHLGIKLARDHDSGSHSAMVQKDHAGSVKVANLHSHLTKSGWKHSEHPSGQLYKHPSGETLTVYNTTHGTGGDTHHEIILEKTKYSNI